MNAARLEAHVLNQIFACDDVTIVLETMRDASFAIGADKFSYHPEVMFEGVASARSEVYAVGFPEEWVELYIKKGWQLVDPGPDITMRLGKPMTWHDALSSRKLTKLERDYVTQTIAFGLTSGYGFPLWGPNGQNAFVAVGFPPDIPLPDEDAISGHHILLLAGHQRICQLTSHIRSPVKLSDREREVLTWVGRGKSNSDVGSILSISADTVATYLRRIYFKLGCHDRIGAVITALRLGLIRI